MKKYTIAEHEGICPKYKTINGKQYLHQGTFQGSAPAKSFANMLRREYGLRCRVVKGAPLRHGFWYHVYGR